MGFDIQMESGLTTITCQGELTIAQISEFKKTITDIIPDSREIIVDLQKITDMDLSCLQLLCSANKFSEQSKISLTRKGRLSAVMKQTLLEAGFDIGERNTEDSCENCFWKGDV